LQVWMTVATWDPQLPPTSFQILVAGGALLLIAGFLLGWRRRNRVMLQRSPLTDELMIYLSRIADAAEMQASRPSAQQIVEMFEKRIEQQRSAEAPAAPKARATPFSTFGREVPEKS
jgi:LPXTG-motif cell wall-anchored protein